MNDLPRQKLIEIVADRKAVLARTGRDVTTDAKLCEALLRDLCGEHRREISVLVAAQKERVAADLLAPQDGAPREVLLTRLTRRLQDNLGLTEEAARWAVDSWAWALEPKPPQPAKPAPAVVSAPPTSRPLTPQPQPRPRARGMPGGCWIVGVLVVIAVLIFALTRSAVKAPPTPVPMPVPWTRPPVSPRLTIPTAPTAVPPTPRPTISPNDQAQTVGKDGMTMLYVPAGEFKMGAASSDTEAASDEKPQHTVYLDAFWIDQTEVTNAMFMKFIDATNYQTDAEQQGSGSVFDPNKQQWHDIKGANWQHPRGPSSNLNGLDNHPVVQVSWNDATAYCHWAGRDLPTEAQWEKAARGDDQRTYPWGPETPAANQLSFNQNAGDTTTVGKYPDGASPYGALDMAGNVWEWVADWWGETYYASSPDRNPAGPSSGERRVLRSGSWFYLWSVVRASYRGKDVPDMRHDSIGFRCARAESPSPVSPTPAPTFTQTQSLSIGSTQVSDKDGMTLLYVPAGEFKMGAADSDPQANSWEKPQHTVYLGAFWIDQTEVTNAMYKMFVDATSYQTDAEKQGSGNVFDPTKIQFSDTRGADWQHPRGPNTNLDGLGNHPVVQVSWNDAKAYCTWAGRDLPTEAQWEKAARWDEANKHSRLYPWGDQGVAGNLLNFADLNLDKIWADWTIDDGYQFTAPVGHYPDGASPYGALDMAGNVIEWAADWYDENYYTQSPPKNPTGPVDGQYRVYRGGAWDAVATNVRASVRGGGATDIRDDVGGFRCAR